MTAVQRTRLLQNDIIACSVDQQNMQKDEKLMKASGFFQPVLVIGKVSLPEYDRHQLPKAMCPLSLEGAH